MHGWLGVYLILLPIIRRYLTGEVCVWVPIVCSSPACSGCCGLRRPNNKILVKYAALWALMTCTKIACTQYKIVVAIYSKAIFVRDTSAGEVMNDR